MNLKERIYTALRGGIPDQIPWTIYRGLLPQDEYAEKLREMGLGTVHIAGAISSTSPNVSITESNIESSDGNLRMLTYKTPVGSLTKTIRTEPGYGSTWTMEHLVKKPEDYAVLEFIINDTNYHANYDTFEQAYEAVGESGFVMTSVERTPVQKLWIEFTGVERFSLDWYEERETVEQILDAILNKQREMWAIVADSPAEFVWCPDNITGEIISPTMFERYLLPYYNNLAEMMHPKGKRLVAHMDGTMQSLVEAVSKTEIDIIEAFTPPPDGNLSVAEAREAWPDKVIWINFPSSMHIASPEQLQAIARDLLQQSAPGDRFLMGVTENIPSEAWRQSLRVITETVNKYGRCPISQITVKE